jgi:hypothetical protein
MKRITNELMCMHPGRDIIRVSSVTEEGIDETVGRILNDRPL